MMKFTLIRTNQQGREYVSTRTADLFLERVKSGGHVARHEVYPCAELRRQADGTTVVRRLNGIVVLTVGPLASEAEVLAIKQAAAMLPTTVAALRSGDGLTVKVLVSYALKTAATAEDETVANVAATTAYEQATMVYSRALGHSISPEEPSVRMHFTAAADAEAVVNLEATPLRLDGSGAETLRLIDFLTAHYQFRFNTVMGYAEFSKRDTGEWQPVDDRVMCTLTIAARLSGLDAWDKDVRRYVGSTMVQPFNPVSDFLQRVRTCWDGHTDHIGRLARTVPCQVPQWEGWFRKWLLYMVAQWLGVTRRYGNSVAPLLISEQGNNKSTFCRRLLPDSLQWGYNDNLLVSEKKQTLMAMSQFLLINLDEFNQISPKLQEGFLKNVIQLASVKVKRPYGRHVEEFPRLASFIATTNETSVLADPTGNRRFIGVELTGAIDLSQPIDYAGLYGQAVNLVERGEQYWFSDDEVRQIIAHNRRFQVRPATEQWFNELFTPVDDEHEGQWLTCAAIFGTLRRELGAAFHGNLISFGRVLSSMEGLRQKHSRLGKLYLVRRRQQ